MFSLRSRRCRPVFAAVAVVALGACGQDNPLAPDLRSTPETGPRRSTTANQAVGGNITIAQCSGPAGTYSYHVGVQGGGNFSLPGSADRTMVFPGPVNCSVGGLVTGYIANNSDTWSGAAATAKVTISATAMPAETQVDSIQYRINGVMQPTLRLKKSVTLNVSFSDEIIVAFWSGHTAQGCGTGYWKVKQHFGEWAASGLAPTQLVGTILSGASAHSLNGKALSNYTLAEALAFPGGNQTSGSAQILIRAAVAAELNSRRPQFGYPLTQDELTNSVNKSLTSNNRTLMLASAVVLEILNNYKCPLR